MANYFADPTLRSTSLKGSLEILEGVSVERICPGGHSLGIQELTVERVHNGEGSLWRLDRVHWRLWSMDYGIHSMISFAAGSLSCFSHTLLQGWTGNLAYALGDDIIFLKYIFLKLKIGQ